MINHPALKKISGQVTRASSGLALSIALSACSGSPPDNLGVHQGHLRDCPASPNCVSSQARDSLHRIAPLALTGDPQQTRARLLGLLTQTPRVKLLVQEEHYLRAEFTSHVMRFVDDVEFLIGPEAVEVRSASRLGHSDLGVNRERIEGLRQQLSQP